MQGGDCVSLYIFLNTFALEGEDRWATGGVLWLVFLTSYKLESGVLDFQ